MWNSRFLKTLYFILCFLLVIPVIGNRDRTTSVQAASLGSQIYVLDLDHFPDPQRRVDWYDIQTFVGTLQGIVNQKGPRLYIRNYKTSPALPYVTNTDTAKINTYWLNKFTQPGQWLSEVTVTPIIGSDIYTALDHLVSTFSSDIQGLIVWDPKVMATVNVATTIAGITGSPIVMSGGALYNRLTSAHGLNVQTGCNASPLTGPCNFTGKFSGANSKTDAYLWAKTNYLDTGLSNPGLLSYMEDSFTSQPNSSSALNYGLSRDYVVKNKGFAFDLSVWSDEKPNDAPEQILGNDSAVFDSILQSSYDRWGIQWPIEIIGFFPWWDKYSTFQSRGIHSEVDGEWKLAEKISSYNGHLSSIMDTIGYLNASFHSWAPTGKQLANPPKAPAKTTLANKTYVLFYMGDHDGGTIHQTFPYLWDDKQRGTVPLTWGIVPNMIQDYPDIAQFIYDTATPNDYFVSGASGAGYANPGSLPDLDNWRQWNEVMNNRAGYTISGFALNGNAGTLSSTAEKIYSYFSNDGLIGLTGQVAGPLPNVRNDNMAVSDNYGIANNDINGTASAIVGLAQAKFTGIGSSPNFLVLRSAFATPAFIEKVYARIKADQPAYNFEAVDPYTFFSLVRQAKKPAADDGIVLSANMPDRMVAGQDYEVSVMVRNVGSSTWVPTGTNSFKLGDFTGNTFVWKKPDTSLIEASGSLSSQRILLNPGESIPPQGTKTFQFTVTAPASAGISNFQAQMVHEGVAWMGSLYTRPIQIVSTSGDQAIVTSVTAPAELVEGTTGTVTVTVKNVGSTIWTSSANYRLAALSKGLQHKKWVPNSMIWSNFGSSGGFSTSESSQRVFLAASDSIASGQSKTFTFSVTAPSKRGKYVFSGQMVHDGVSFFGTAFEKEINIVPPGRNGKNAVVVDTTIPSYMAPNSTRRVTVSVKNTGTETWTAAGLYRLANHSSSPANEFLFSNFEDGGYSNAPTDQRVFLNGSESVAPEQTKSFTFDITAPSTPGAHTLSLDMVQDGVAFFNNPLVFSISVGSGDNSTVVNHSIPSTLSNGAIARVSVEFLNSGNTVWSKADQYELITTSNNQFKIADFGLDGGSGTLPTAQNIFMSDGLRIGQGGRYQFETYGFDIQAPASGTSAILEMQLAKNGVPFGNKLNINIALNSGYTARVDVGSSSSYTDSKGNTWSADQAYVSGSWGYSSGTATATATGAVTGADYDSALFQTGRTGSPLSYKFDVANGTYRVTLLFAELTATQSAQRLFGLKAESADILSGFDIYKMFSGKNKGKAYSFEVPVSDGQLNLDFSGQTGAALVNGIQVTRFK
ncbi:malectin domain-containing carbohydrate-binding protein [Paenibacillus sp. PAMC21692]|uniref:malectin domain-containing carbohydrate-binding protein n=1 Tax=Paenibacillus sp. PAMC21692 TaxID=2762320 RepID=UPI00164DF791|nr:malectin domain-containing carbohydrate-binding protein [Paenibacillus sp. PAMC21692]QNK57239.1 hypothetical protein H7F31_32985 [Paenibacillus sp. PAMC21692]